MANEQAIGSGRGNHWRIAGWGFAASLLLLPFLAMRFTNEVEWTASDFVVAAVLLGSVGFAFELTVRKSGNLAFRLGAATAVIATFLTIWVNGAVGMIGSEGNLYNLLFGGVLLIALAGAITARFQAAGMARAMVLAAIAQAVVGAGGLSLDALGGILSVGFAAPWLLSSWLFRKAARQA